MHRSRPRTRQPGSRQPCGANFTNPTLNPPLHKKLSQGEPISTPIRSTIRSWGFRVGPGPPRTKSEICWTQLTFDWTMQPKLRRNISDKPNTKSLRTETHRQSTIDGPLAAGPVRSVVAKTWIKPIGVRPRIGYDRAGNHQSLHPRLPIQQLYSSIGRSPKTTDWQEHAHSLHSRPTEHPPHPQCLSMHPNPTRKLDTGQYTRGRLLH